MRIDAVEIYHVAMPLLYPWRTAYGEDAAVESVLVRLHASELAGGGKLSAWGESSPLAAPCYSPEWAGGVFAVLRDWLAPAIVFWVIVMPFWACSLSTSVCTSLGGATLSASP